MSSNSIRTAAVFLLLVGIGVAGRFLFRDMPNFTPTVAVALFAGFYFRSMLVAVAVPVSAMLISNLWLESYGSLGVMFTTYAAFCFPVLMRGLLRKPGKSHVSTAMRFATGALAPSLVFYLSTNLAVWWCQSMYAHTAAGLGTCYYYAMPFYRMFLQGDLLFIPMVFGTYAVARYLAAQSQASPARELSLESAVA